MLLLLELRVWSSSYAVLNSLGRAVEHPIKCDWPAHSALWLRLPWVIIRRVVRGSGYLRIHMVLETTKVQALEGRIPRPEPDCEQKNYIQDMLSASNRWADGAR